MTALAASQTPAPSRTHRDENFPVASWLIAARLRPAILAFYDFARAADDVADSPSLAADAKLAELDAFERGLDGDADAPPVAARLRRTLAEIGVADRHARDLLRAFRQDAAKSRYADMRELFDYCELSAAPVGRFVLELHGERDAGVRRLSDALCAALQILNHLQDAADDLRRLDRVYLPNEMLARHGASVDDLRKSRLTAGLRATMDEVLNLCAARIAPARDMPRRIRDRRLAAEVGAIQRLAARLERRLRRSDPLARRVAPTRSDFARAALGGVWDALAARRKG